MVMLMGCCCYYYHYWFNHAWPYAPSESTSWCVYEEALTRPLSRVCVCCSHIQDGHGEVCLPHGLRCVG